MNSASAGRLRTIDLVVYPGFKALEAIATMSVFEYANIHLELKGRPRAFHVTVASSRKGEVRSDMLMSLDATKSLDEHHLPDIAIFVGARGIEEALHENPRLVEWARNVGPRVTRLVGLCSGSFFLAAAGLLDGKDATTHWSVADLLKRRFGRVNVEADAIYLNKGRLWTSAGVTACIDLALALVEEDCGRTIALDVARDLVVYLKRSGGQSQFSVHLASQNTNHAGIRQAQDWILSNIDQVMALPDLADRASMSERNFRRVFVKEVGMAPLDFIETVRLDTAKRLLEDADLPLKSIASRVGFASEQSLRKLFVRRMGIAPDDYRARFSGAGRAT